MFNPTNAYATVSLQSVIDEYKTLFPQAIRGIQQCSDEVAQLMAGLNGRRFESMAEIGVDEGGSLWLYALLLGQANCKFTVVDTTISEVARVVIKTIEARMPIRFIIIQARSENVTLGNVDFLHIDGDHSYEGIKLDFSNHYPSVEKDGICLLHDTNLWEGPIQFKHDLELDGYNCVTLKGHNLISGNFGKEGENLSTGITVVQK